MTQKYQLYEEIAHEVIKNDNFFNCYSKLLTKQKFGNTNVISDLNTEEIIFLIRSASIFVFCKNDKIVGLGYKIASILSERYSLEYDNLNSIIQYVVICSGQMPVIKKMINDGHIDYFSLYNESNIPFNPLQFRCVLSKQVTNLIGNYDEGENVYLTDFQAKNYLSLSNGKNISISAPTSSGKSFLLSNFIRNQILVHDSINIIYIVPTKALIAQVIADITNILIEDKDDKILILSSYVDDYYVVKKKIFVLTQERYHNILFDSSFDELINILVIDEAQKISDESRGLLLENVIKESLIRYPKIQTIFLSPYSSNPEKLGTIFRIKDMLSSKTLLSPVSQNLLLLNISSKEYSLSLSTHEFNSQISLDSGTIQSNFKYSKNDPEWKIYWSVNKFGDGFNLIYCTSREKCVKYALDYCQNLAPINNSTVKDITSFLRKYVHPDYSLIYCLERGIGYHHGNMPLPIRGLVEDLFKNRIINSLFCTSTLLEGVNLPAKNIFIYKPLTGKKPIESVNFWNLAGRAGRLLKDYYGNIYCINIEEWKGFKPNIEQIEYSIKSRLEELLVNKKEEIINDISILKNNYRLKDKVIEQTITHIFIRSLKETPDKFVENMMERNSDISIESLKEIQKGILGLQKEVKIPIDILQKNPSINPLIQQKLFETFLSYPDETPIPLHPLDNAFYYNFKLIFRIIDVFFLDIKNDQYKYFSTIANKWIFGSDFSDFINYQIRIAKKKEDIIKSETVNKIIEKTFSEINTKIQFEYQKNIKCYTDLIKYSYSLLNKDDSSICESLPLFLEYGTFKQNEIFLQSLGISRYVSSLINGIINEKFNNVTHCSSWVHNNKALILESTPDFFHDELIKIFGG